MATKNEKQHYIAGQLNILTKLADMLKDDEDSITLSRFWIKEWLIELGGSMFDQIDDETK